MLGVTYSYEHDLLISDTTVSYLKWHIQEFIISLPKPKNQQEWLNFLHALSFQMYYYEVYLTDTELPAAKIECQL